MDGTLLSVVCLTYNQALFIRKCLDGIIMQKTSFKFEIIIHDDASSDGTTEIIREFQAKHPIITKIIIQTENQYSKNLSFGNILETCLNECNGEYIAFCEGDDYWIDPLKLQRQVDFLKLHPNYSFTCHEYLCYNNNTQVFYYIDQKQKRRRSDYGYTLNPSRSYWIQLLSIVARKSSITNIPVYKYKLFRDVHLIFHLLESGNCMYMNFIGGVYRHSEIGIASQIDKTKKIETGIKVYSELLQFNPHNTYLHRTLGLMLAKRKRMNVQIDWRGMHISLKSKLYYFLYYIYLSIKQQC